MHPPSPERVHPRVPLGTAFAAQLGGCLAVLGFAQLLPGVAAQTGPFGWAIAQGFAAAALSRWLGMPAWWLPIHASFVPGLVAVLAFGPDPRWAFAAFLVLASLYWGVSRSRVPLYLTSRRTEQALVRLLPQGGFSFLDLGCGLGGLLARLEAERPEGRYEGIEAAPIPFLLSWLRASLGRCNGRVRWGNYAKLDLGRYDVVYAYLSPAAMEGLWHKARREMRPGALLISNSFAIPGVPECERAVAGGEPGLLVWRL